MSETLDFLKNIEPGTPDTFNQELVEPEQKNSQDESKEAEEQKEEKSSMNLRNRRERRLASQLTQKNEENIALNARLQAIEDAQRTRNSSDADYLKVLEKIFGTTPETIESTEILKKAFSDMKESAAREALEQFRRESEKERQAVAQAEKKLDTIIEDVEDEYNVDLTSDTPLRRGFLKALEKASPKDRDGNIVDYADGQAIFELFNKSRERMNNSQAKDLASKSMTPSGQSNPSSLQEDATVRFLKENGII